MVNAIEHGNLGITYREKTLLLMENDWRRRSPAGSNCRNSATASPACACAPPRRPVL